MIRRPPIPPPIVEQPSQISRIPVLDRAAVGQPVTRRGISLFSVYLPGNRLPDIATGPDAGLQIEELPNSAVPHLRIGNPTKKPIFLPEGVQLIGGLQDRAPNISVLVAPESELDLPVSCLERGRWGSRTGFRHGDAFAPRRTRRTKNAQVSLAVQRNGSRRSDQARVWHTIDQELKDRRIVAPTSAIRAVEESLRYDAGRVRVVDELLEKGPLPEQCGIAVTHGWRVVAVDIFGDRSLLSAHWQGLVRSYLSERPTADGRPSPTRTLGLINRLNLVSATQNPGLGMGVEMHVTDRLMTAQALVLDDSLVHASALMPIR
ncbi:MAG: hypothetical protein F4135_09300 [Acidimicrobiia bacterium]|nr:hypothetical protein [Acidimicrobiia bacterium]